MIKKCEKNTKDYYNQSYHNDGFLSQRKYPNEELSRFMGRNFFSVPTAKRTNIKILEIGCGSGANLWMIAKEGFQAYGIDLSQEGINLAEKMLHSYNVSGRLSAQDMCDLNFDDNYFDAIVDVFSSNCMNSVQGEVVLEGVYKKLKKGGVFFTYFPCKNSDAFKNHEPSKLIDNNTLDSIMRSDSPFSGQDYPFRFLHSKEYEDLLTSKGFSIQYSEIIERSYNNKKENFSWCVIEARKKTDD